MRFIRLLILITFCLFNGCKHQVTKPSDVSAPYTQANRVLPYFSSVYIKAPVNVNLNTGRSTRVTIKGSRRDVSRIYTTVKDHTLYVTVNNPNPKAAHRRAKLGPVNLNINMRNISHFTYNGVGQVVGHIQSSDMCMRIKNPATTSFDGQITLNCLTVVGPGYTQISGVRGDHLVVNLYRNPKVQLTGMAALKELNIRGDAAFSFYWVRTPSLVIRGKKGAGKIQLAGIADRLDVELWGRTYLDASQLRTRETFVKTHDHALAKIATTQHQHTLAKDASDIYFYNLPPNKTDFMGKNGAVLDMRHWNLLLEQPYTEHNK